MNIPPENISDEKALSVDEKLLTKRESKSKLQPTFPEVHKFGKPQVLSSENNTGVSHPIRRLNTKTIDKTEILKDALKPGELNTAALSSQQNPITNKHSQPITVKADGRNGKGHPHDDFIQEFNTPNVVVNQPRSSNANSSGGNALKKRSREDKCYYGGDADQFHRTLTCPPLDHEGFADFEPESLGPDFCITFRRMLNYKFRNKSGHIMNLLDSLNMLCVRALPDVPVAIEFAKEVDQNARMRPRTFALCGGEDMLPKYYAVEYTPPKTALLNCICCMSCFRQPFNLAIFGLDGELALRIVSGHLENCWLLRYSKECCCHQGIVKRLLIKTPDDAVIGSLVEFGHCFMTQWLQIHPGVPQTGADLADAAVVQFQSKCRCMDSLMLYCGCKTDPDTEGAMIMADKEGRKYATARPWSGITSEDSSFLFTVRFAKNCPVEMKALALAGSFIYNNLNWETRSDLTCCMLISCLFCTLRLYYDGGPVTYDYDNWSNLRTRPATAYIPWLSVNRPAVVNYRRS